MYRTLMTTTVVATAALLAMPAVAADQGEQQSQSGSKDSASKTSGGQLKVMGESSQMKGGWRAERLLDADVYDADGDEIGEVENLYIGPDGKIQKVLIETEDGFLGLGEQFLAVNWDDVTFSSQANRVETQVDMDNLKKYSILDDEPDEEGRNFRATELIGDYVRLTDAQYYGYVTDLVFDQEGKLQGLVTTADVAYGAVPRRVIPYAAADEAGAFQPGTDFYPAPYTAEEIEGQPEYEEGLFD